MLLDEFDAAVTRVTILPRGSNGGGYTSYTPSEEQLESGLYSYNALLAQMAVSLGGRIAEEIAFGETEITISAANDLQQVRSIARRMVAQWGFGAGELRGAPVAWEEPGGNSVFGARAASRHTEILIDEEVRRLVDLAEGMAVDALMRNLPLLHDIAETLSEKETLGAAELAQMLEAHLSGDEVRAPRAAPSAPSRGKPKKRILVRMRKYLKKGALQLSRGRYARGGSDGERFDI